MLASPADILRGASRVLAQRGAGTRDASLRMSAGEASSLHELRVQWPKLKNHIIIFKCVIIADFFFVATAQYNTEIHWGVIQDFTDPGLPKIRRTLTGLSLWFCLHKCYLRLVAGISSNLAQAKYICKTLRFLD